MKNLRLYIEQIGLAFDQMINALWPSVFWGHLSFADETLSARCFRANRDGKAMGRLMPVIDWLFRWQGFPDHCARAYTKEMERRGLPPEYRGE